MLRKLFILAFLFIFSSFIHSQDATLNIDEIDGIETGDPNIYALSPANGAIIWVSGNSTTVNITYSINNLESCWFNCTYRPFEVRLKVDGVEKPVYKDPERELPPGPNPPCDGYNFLNLSYSGSYQITLPKGSHSVYVYAKNFEVKLVGTPFRYLDIDEASKTNYFSIQNIPPLSATISGPTTINWGVNATWNANASGGYPPYHYQWWYKYPGNEERPLYETKDIDPGEITPDLPQPGYWNQIAIDSPTLTRHDYLNHYLKCVVKDAHNTSVTSNILFINVIGGSSPLPLPKEIDNTKIENKELSLGNYPNPFNPTTKLKVMIPDNGMISLKIYDIIGREVAILANDIFEAGEYEFDFDANSLPSGTYISALTANNKTITQKLLLIK